MPLSTEVANATSELRGTGVSRRRDSLEKPNTAEPCRRCRGRGWKHVGSRSSLALSTAAGRARATSKRRCLDCDGTGRE